MRRAVRIALMGPLFFFFCCLMTAAYPLWRFGFWIFNDPPPAKGMVRMLWQEYWDEVILAP